MAGTLTTANASIQLSVPGLFDTPLLLQGYAADDIFGTEPIDNGEVSMGVDGNLSAGFVFVAVKQSYNLQANSDSNLLFDELFNAEQAAAEKFPVTGLVTLLAINSKWTMRRGFMTTYQPIPDGGKILKARKHTITWERVQKQPT